MAKLKLTAAPTFKSKVDIPIPGGASSKVEFTFKHKPKDEFDQWVKALKDNPGDGPDTALVMEVACGWDLEDVWSEENVALLLQSYYGAAGAITRKYTQELMGARTGN